MNAIGTIESRLVSLPRENVDTDQIIPARFLKGTERSGLGRGLFADWRLDAAGEPRPDFPLNDPSRADARILVAGDNFGCGSSREHAPWALLDFGIQAVISTRFADIFRNNSLGNGLLVIAVDDLSHRSLADLAQSQGGGTCRIDLEAQEIRWGATPESLGTGAEGGVYRFEIDPFARRCLLQGVDRLAYLQQATADLEAFEERHSIHIDTRLAFELGTSNPAPDSGRTA